MHQDHHPSPTRFRRRHFARTMAACAAVITALGVGLGAVGTVGASAAARSSSGGFIAPNLHGDKIVFAVGSQQDVSDAQLYVVTKILKSWGAKASIINVTSDAIAVTEVLSGAANVGYIGTNGTIDSGLTSFAPALPHVDYQLVTAAGYKTIQSLVGKGTFSYSKPSGIEGEMWAIALNYSHLSPNSISVIETGGQSTRLAALLTGRIQAAFLDSVHYHELISTQGGAGFNDALNMAKVAPQLADSTLSAGGGWLANHSRLATAVGEAWLQAAKLFQTDQKAWVQDAYTYSNESGGAAETKADATLQYRIYKADQEFLLSSSDFSAAHAHYNEVIANSVGSLPNGAPALNAWFTASYWLQACKALGVK